ncbi:MAG: hypothetical protein EPO39_17055 [Candidatus Manganitrophaceae bacterium]|nr:MAG: hypothetical protein EPO39_17055 [Candidatus Manganitrophaceae bacterium]
MTLIPLTLMECDQCQRRFDPMDGGICSKCRRLLCSRHLHGWFQGWRVFKRDAPLCVNCRRAPSR